MQGSCGPEGSKAGRRDQPGAETRRSPYAAIPVCPRPGPCLGPAAACATSARLPRRPRTAHGRAARARAMAALGAPGLHEPGQGRGWGWEQGLAYTL